MRIVARIQGDSLTASQLEQMISTFPDQTPADMVEEWATASLIHLRAARKGLLDDPEIIRRLQRAESGILGAELVRTERPAAKDPSARQIRRYFDRHFHDFRVGRPMARGLILFHTNEDTIRLAAGLFQEGQTSDQIRRRLPGITVQNTGYVYRSEILPAYTGFLFDSTQEISDVIHLPPWYMVIKRTGRRESEHHFTLGEVQETIRARLKNSQLQKQMKDFRSELASDLNVSMDSTLLREILRENPERGSR